MSRDEIGASLSAYLAACGIEPFFVAIFGSVARNALHPNDCDVALVYDLLPGTPPWKEQIRRLRDLKLRFYEQWRIRLSPLPFSRREIEDARVFLEEIGLDEVVVIRSPHGWLERGASSHELDNPFQAVKIGTP